MSAGLRSVVAVALLLAAQALAQDGFCTEAVPDCEDAECKCAGSGTMVTDPVELGAGISVYRHEDVRLPAVLEELSYRRSYTSADETWTFFPVAGPPMPFGPAPGLMPDGGETLRWWHSYFAFAREAQDYDEPPTPSYYVRTVDGRFSEFGRCAPTPCFGTNDTFWSEKERKDRLERTDAGFVHHQKDGRRFVFDSTWGEDGGVTHYFLSRVLDRNGVPAATVEYSTPTGLGVTCREGQSGVTTSGVPYVSRVVTAEGSALQFAYRRLPSPNGGADLCVVGSVGVLDRATSSSQTAVTYAYAADGGTETAGLVASATFSSGGRQLTYAYSPTGFVITGQSTVTHTYTDAGSTDAGSKVVVSAATTPTENVSILYEGSLHGRDVGCIADAIVSTRTLTDSFAQRGDGDAGTAGWTRNSDVEIQFTGNGDPRLVGYEDTCSTPACSPGTGESRFSCLYPSEDTVPPRLLGTKDKRGNWTAYSYALGPDDAGTPAQLELTSVTYGAQDTWGDGGLEAKRFTYSYGTAAHQRHASTEQPSLLGGSSAITETRVVYDGDRIAARLEKGWTKTVGGSTELRYRGVFYFKRHACLGGSNDSLSRTLEVHGPCWVDAAQGFAATDCSSTLNSTVQVAQLFYYPTTMPDGGSYGNKAGRLSKLRSFTDATMSGCGSASYMDMDYEDYDAIGNTTSVRDQNGHLTTMTFQDGRLRTLAKADAGFTFTYDGESVTSVRNPEGNYDVFCWRAGTSGSACTGGTLTDKLQWQAKAPTATGDSFSEKVAYVYWTNGTVASASYLAADGGVLRVERYAVDVHRRPTWQGWGDTSGAAVFSAKRAYDGADNLVGVGHASNAPPAWCGGVSSGAPVSSLCQKLGYDRADRLESASDTGTSQATVFQHDVHGNTTGVKTGCGTSDTYSSCSQPAATYTFDDFGNMVAATLPWTLESGGSGVTRYEFDARGLVVKKQTPSMRAASATYDVLESAWDGVGRPLSLVHRYGSGAGDVEALWAMAYDATGTPPSGCTAPANTMGRLRRKTDSFGDTWYRYDEWGRVTREVRVRASVGNCSGDALDTL
ncbi:MAG: hypothetical protein HY906_13490 [Deltaproteobacteria bacterium]|nr:hypothetical protein [Deltaproteobacteria bacterium]